MDKEYIGPIFWNVIHKLALYSNNFENKIKHVRVIIYLLCSFPCDKCQKDMEIILSKYDKTISKSDLFKWTFEIHNSVNKKLNKEQLDFDTAKEKQRGELYREEVWNILHIIASRSKEEQLKNFYNRTKLLFEIIGDGESLQLIPDNKPSNNSEALIWTIFARNQTNIDYEKTIKLRDIQSLLTKCKDCELNAERVHS